MSPVMGRCSRLLGTALTMRRCGAVNGSNPGAPISPFGTPNRPTLRTLPSLPVTRSSRGMKLTICRAWSPSRSRSHWPGSHRMGVEPRGSGQSLSGRRERRGSARYGRRPGAASLSADTRPATPGGGRALSTRAHERGCAFRTISPSYPTRLWAVSRFQSSSGIGVARASRKHRTSSRRSDTAAACASLQSPECKAQTVEGALCPKPMVLIAVITHRSQHS